MEDEKIVKGFNAGYEIARKDLDLAKTLAESYKGKETSYTLAFEKGINEWVIEEKTKQMGAMAKSRSEKFWEENDLSK